MKVPVSFRGPYVVARHEFLVNLKSVRLLIMIIVLALLVVGGAYGLRAGTGGGGVPRPSALVWAHPAIEETGGNVTVVWVSNPFGNPEPDRLVSFRDLDDGTVLGESRTDVSGFVRFSMGERTEVEIRVTLGLIDLRQPFFFFEPTSNFTTFRSHDDLDNDGLYDDLGIHVLTREGVPALANVSLNDTFVTSATPGEYGYARIELPPGHSNVTVEVAGESETTPEYVAPRAVQPPFAAGPDFVLLVIAAFFAPFVLPVFAIVIAFDAVSKERVQGTLDLLLSRPLSRPGALLGKLAGTFAAVGVPVTLVNLVGVGVLAAVSGRAPTGSFTAAFLGLALLLVAFYVLLQLVFSTLAKTSGTAVLFGVLLWLAFNVLYPVITTVLSLVLFMRDAEAAFRLLQVSVLGNPSQIYQQLVVFAAPEEVGGFGQGGVGGTTILDLPIVATAAGVWLAVLLALALWTFHRKAV